jgi:hypothetical protein
MPSVAIGLRHVTSCRSIAETFGRLQMASWASVAFPSTTSLQLIQEKGQLK